MLLKPKDQRLKLNFEKKNHWYRNKVILCIYYFILDCVKSILIIRIQIVIWDKHLARNGFELSNFPFNVGEDLQI